jgi:hypothetical protein
VDATGLFPLRAVISFRGPRTSDLDSWLNLPDFSLVKQDRLVAVR